MISLGLEREGAGQNDRRAGDIVRERGEIDREMLGRLGSWVYERLWVPGRQAIYSNVLGVWQC